MFKNAFRLPLRLLGIPLYLDVTFLIILPLLAWLIGSQLGPFIEIAELPIDPEPLTEGATPYLLGLSAAVALFVSVVIHEFGHAVTARVYGVETERITLWLLGGMAQFKEMPKERGGEAVVAIAGPITSFGLGVLCLLGLRWVPTDMGGLYFVVYYTMYMNFLLGLFNLVPALPLDGGRVLRSLLALRMGQLRATEVSAGISRFLAIALGLFGLWAFNLFLILIAFFIYIAGTAETRYAMLSETLSHFQVNALMSSPVATMSPELRVGDARDQMFAEARLAYPVKGPTGECVGVIDIDRLRERGSAEEIGAIMGPPPEVVPGDSSADELFDLMVKEGHSRVLVVGGGGEVAGIVTKTDLIRALQIAGAGFGRS